MIYADFPSFFGLRLEDEVSNFLASTVESGALKPSSTFYT